MAHYHSGLPPMDLEPFDPTPLWEATNASRNDKPTISGTSRWTALRAGAAVVLALAATVAGVFLLG